MRNTLVATVGSSLYSNIDHLGEKANIPEMYQALWSAYQNNNFQQIVLALLAFSPSEHICGAEINSITSIINQHLLDQPIRLFLLVSDTETGRNIGRVLKSYYTQSNNPHRFAEVEVEVLTDLRVDDTLAFQRGLRDLVRKISALVRRFSSESLVINATGGFKAQISFAGMIGEALHIPVCYQFERFDQVIMLPPQPIALDLAAWLEESDLFFAIEAHEAKTCPMSTEHLAEIRCNELLSTLMENVGDDLVEFTPMGALFHERCRDTFLRQETVLLAQCQPIDLAPARKKLHLRDDHGKDVLEKVGGKLLASPYVKEIINSLPYNPQRVEPIRRITEDGIVELVLVETDAGLGLVVQTTGRNRKETNTIALHLVKKYLS